MDEEKVYPECSPNCYPNWYLTYFTNSQRNENETGYGLLNGGGNPFYFGLATLVNKAIDTVPLNSPEIVGLIHGGMAYVLECNSTVYDVEYDSVNGTITRFDTSKSNDSVASIFKGALGARPSGPTISSSLRTSPSSASRCKSSATSLPSVLDRALRIANMSNNVRASDRVPLRSPYSNDEYTVGWVCALPIEMAAAKGMMDEEHGDSQISPQHADQNTYIPDRISSYLK